MHTRHDGGWYLILAGYCLKADALAFPSADLPYTLSGQQHLGDALCIATSNSWGLHARGPSIL